MNNNEEIIALAAQIEAAGDGEIVDLPVGTQREEATAWMREHSGRLWDQMKKDARLVSRKVECKQKCQLFDVYDVPGVGPVIVKMPLTRGQEHAKREAAPRSTTDPETAETKTRLIVAPVRMLVAAAGGQPIAGLLTCADHLEADLSPASLLWIASQRGKVTIDPEALLHKGIDVRRAPGLTGGDITFTMDAIGLPPCAE